MSSPADQASNFDVHVQARRWPCVLTPARLAWAALLLSVLTIAVDQIRREGSFRVDDAYITFSFSKNLGTGHGPVFSHGLRVEGYSNFLWMLVVAVRYLFLAQGDPYDYARFMAFACLAAGVFASYRLARRAARPLIALSAVALLACCSDLFRAAASGLETAAYAAAIVIGWAVYLAEPRDRRRWSLLAFVPAALLRIDGFVPLLIVFGVELLTAISQRRFSLLKLTRWAAPAFAVWGAYFAWRYAYYGLPLPTTYYAKVSVNANDPDRGFRQAWEFIRDYGALPLLPLLVVPLVRGPRRSAVSLGIAVLFQVIYAMTVGGDWMPFNRFFLPIVPLVAVLAAHGLEQVWRLGPALGWLPRWASRLAVILALGFCAEHMHSRWTDTPIERDKLGFAAGVTAHTRDNLLASKDLMALVVRRPGERLMTDYPGVFSVFTDAEIIDVWGLCNEDVALHGNTSGINPIYGLACPECYARAKPDYLHVGVPIVRGEGAFHNISEVINNTFHAVELDRLIQLRRRFGVGRVVEEATGRTLWFLERRRPELPLETRRPAAGIRVDYPFEHGD